MNTARPRRSVLYTPGSNPRALSKALGSGADAVILDLEDAVAPGAKFQARQNVSELLSRQGAIDVEIVVRVNGIDTPWCEGDVEAISQFPISAVLFPKVSAAADAIEAENLLDSARMDHSTKLWCMLETPLGILNAHEIAGIASRSSTRMKAWVIGTNDLAKELGATEPVSRQTLAPALGTALLAARAYGLTIIDGVYNEFQDLAGFEAEARLGRDMGFDGKTLIHPMQVELCNRIFSPTPEAIEQARLVLEAFDRAHGHGVIQIGGKMVELLHADSARRLIAIADAIARPRV